MLRRLEETESPRHNQYFFAPEVVPELGSGTRRDLEFVLDDVFGSTKCFRTASAVPPLVEGDGAFRPPVSSEPAGEACRDFVLGCSLKGLLPIASGDFLAGELVRLGLLAGELVGSTVKLVLKGY